MRPPPRAKTDYEQVATDDWIVGKIAKIEYDENYKRMWEGQEKIGPAVRLKFDLEGYQYPKSSGWMTFAYGEKCNLYKKYLTALVEGAAPDMQFDLDQLQDLPVKIMFKQNGEYQNVEIIRPLKAKVKPDIPF
jgi:hypothetical protein